jgi:hypothetical protein
VRYADINSSKSIKLTSMNSSNKHFFAHTYKFYRSGIEIRDEFFKKQNIITR